MTAFVIALCAALVGFGLGRLSGYRRGLTEGLQSAAPQLAPPRPPRALPVETPQLVWLDESDHSHIGRFEGHPFVVVCAPEEDRVCQVRMLVPGLPTDVRMGHLDHGQDLRLQTSRIYTSADLVCEGHEATVMALTSDKVTQALLKKLTEAYDLLIESGRLVLTLSNGPSLAGIQPVLQDCADLVPRLRVPDERLVPKIVDQAVAGGTIRGFGFLTPALRLMPPGEEGYRRLRSLTGGDLEALYILARSYGAPAHADLEKLARDHAISERKRVFGLRWIIEHLRFPDRAKILEDVATADPSRVLRTLAAEALLRDPPATGLPPMDALACDPWVEDPDLSSEAESVFFAHRPTTDPERSQQGGGDERSAHPPDSLRLQRFLDAPIPLRIDILPREDADIPRSSLMQFGGINWLVDAICCGEPSDAASWATLAPESGISEIVTAGYEIVIRGDQERPFVSLTRRRQGTIADELAEARARMSDLLELLPPPEFDRSTALAERALTWEGTDAWRSLAHTSGTGAPEHPLVAAAIAGTGEEKQRLFAASRVRESKEPLKAVALDTTLTLATRKSAIGTLLRQHGGSATLPVLHGALEQGPDDLRTPVMHMLVRISPRDADIFAVLASFVSVDKDLVEEALAVFTEVGERAIESLLIDLLQSDRDAILSPTLTRLAKHPSPAAIQPLEALVARRGGTLGKRAKGLLAEIRTQFSEVSGAVSMAEVDGQLTLVDAEEAS